MNNIFYKPSLFISGAVLLGTAIISAIFFSVPKTAAVATYSYLVTSLQPVSCPGGSDLTPSNLTSPGDSVTILGTGFGNRSVSDGTPEMLYMPINGALKMVYRGQRDEGGPVYFGLHGWSDNAIDIEVAEGQGSSLGSYIILRTYPGTRPDANGALSQSDCNRGTLSIACDSSTYSDWGACQPDGTQTRTISSSSPNGCSVVNPILSQSCTYTPPTCTSFTYSNWGTCSNGQQARSIVSSSPNNCAGGTPVLTQACTPTCTLNDYSCGNWDSCSADGVQIRTCTKNSTCEGGISPPTSQSCTYTASVCTSWTYSDWGICTANGQRTRTIVSSLPIGCAGGNPQLNQSCTTPTAQKSPEITGITPGRIKLQGTEVEITGENFGNDKMLYNGRLYDHDGGTLQQIISWSDTKIKAVINIKEWNKTTNIAKLYIRVKCLDCSNANDPNPTDYVSNTFSIDVATGPSIISISPEIIEKGMSVTLRGSKFTNLSGSYIYSCSTCKVLINGAEVSGISLYNWSDESVSFTMPNNATSGYIQIQDSKGNISEKFNFTIKTFADQHPISITSVLPTAIIPGELIAITGNGFGTWDTTTTLTIGGIDLMRVTSWDDTTIKVIFPLTGQFGQKVRIKKCKYSWSTSDNECSFAVSNETISLKKNSDDPLSGLQWYLEKINMLQAWQITQGSQDVVVAVIDSGVDTNHEDLTHSIWLNQKEIENNGEDDDKNNYKDDKKGWNFAYSIGEMTPYDSHGTKVAGVIASKKDNQIGITGIAPNVKIMPLTVFDMPDAEGQSSASLENIVKAVKYAVDNGADIINLSLGGEGKTNDYSNRYDEIFEYAYDHNVLIVTAAGNGDIYGQAIGYARGQNLAVNPDSPVCNDGDKNWVVGVGASNNENLRTAWSNYGACIDVWAPGEDIVTASLPPNNYASADGTSFSAPIVSGIAALIKSIHPDWNVEEIKTVLINSQTNLIIDAYKAITASRPNVSYRPNIDTKLDEGNFQNITIVDTKPDVSRDEKPIAVEIPFPDIRDSKYQEAINILKQEGFVKGNPDGTFKPFSTLNRAEFMTILMHNLPDEIPEAPKTGCGFSDVKASDWFAKSICFAKSKGYAKGYPNDTFKPGNPVNFVEALALTERIFNWPISEDKEEWFRPFVIYAEAKNVIPESINSFDQKITREEMAELVVRVLKDKEGSLDSYLGTKTKSSKITYVCLKNRNCNTTGTIQNVRNTLPSHIEVIYATVRIRNGIGYDATILETVNLGQRFEIIGEKNAWYQIKRASGETGWIEGKWVRRID